MNAFDTPTSKPSSTHSHKPSTSKLFTSLNQAVWRWHFYAGIIFAPFLLILAISGSMYLFKPQIEGYLYKDMLMVQNVGTNAMTADAIIGKTLSGYPGTTISSVTIPDDPELTVKLTAIRNGISTTMYADPYTGNITGILNSDETFSAFFKKCTASLSSGEHGRTDWLS